MDAPAGGEHAPEEDELVTVRRRVRARFADAVSVDVIDRVIDAYAARWAGAPVRNYLPVLVERFSTEELRRVAPEPPESGRPAA